MNYYSTEGIFILLCTLNIYFLENYTLSNNETCAIHYHISYIHHRNCIFEFNFLYYDRKTLMKPDKKHLKFAFSWFILDVCNYLEYCNIILDLMFFFFFYICEAKCNSELSYVFIFHLIFAVWMVIFHFPLVQVSR